MLIKRELDGAFFRVERDGRWENVCFTDLDEHEREEMLKARTPEWLKGMCLYLAARLRAIGDACGLSGIEDDD